jgi:hypothetical protein
MDNLDDYEVDNTQDDYTARENMWDQAWPTTSAEATEHPLEEPDTLDAVSPFPETVGTSDPIRATRDAEPYTPPTDPPVLPGGEEGVHVATGFGFSPEEEAYHDPAPRGDEDIRAEALLTLQQDSLTSKYPLDVRVNRGVVHLRGEVPSIDDAEHAQAVLSNLSGVVDVVDDTTLAPSALE